jgi:uncharacterized protein
VNRSNSRPLRRAAKLLPVLFTCLGLHMPPAGAAELEAALAAVERRDYTSAIPQLDALAAAGNPVALAQLAALYQAGKGVGKDTRRAAALYEEAAQRGNADAQFNLGNMYLLGEGVPQDDDWAFTYYRAAARQGHAMAQKNVREFYRAAGLAPPPDEVAPRAAEAAAAEPGGGVAAVAADPAPDPAAVASTPLPVAPAAPPATYTSDELKAMQIARQHGIRIEQAPAPPVGTESAPATGHVDQWQPPAAAEPPVAESTRLPGDPELAQAKALLASGKPADALQQLQAQATAGHAEAQFLLSQLLVTLNRGPQDEADALRWLQRSAAGGQVDAQFALGARYERGNGVTADDAEAITWYRAAARQGHAQARERLRAIYREAGIPLPEELAPPPAGHDGAALPVGRTGVTFTDDSLNQRLCIHHAYSLQAV